MGRLTAWPNGLALTWHTSAGEWDLWPPEHTSAHVWVANYTPRGESSATKHGEGASPTAAMQNARPLEVQ